MNRFFFRWPHFLPTGHMGDQPESSASFRALFESAFQVYEKTTGISLAEHPFAIQLQSCHSTESMTALVQDQASTFNEFREKDRVTKSVKSTLSINLNQAFCHCLPWRRCWPSMSTGSWWCLTLARLMFFHSLCHLQLLSTLALVFYFLYVPCFLTDIQFS